MKLKYLIEASAALAEAGEIEASQAIEDIIDRELQSPTSAADSPASIFFLKTATPAKKSRRNNHEK